MTMKCYKFIVCLGLLIVTCLQVDAQQLTQKYNSFYDRTEFFDGRGRMVGYAKYNSFYDRLEYYDASGNLLKTEKQNNFYDRKDINDGNGNNRGYEKKNNGISIYYR